MRLACIQALWATPTTGSSGQCMKAPPAKTDMLKQSQMALLGESSLDVDQPGLRYRPGGSTGSATSQSCHCNCNSISRKAPLHGLKCGHPLLRQHALANAKEHLRGVLQHRMLPNRCAPDSGACLLMFSQHPGWYEAHGSLNPCLAAATVQTTPSWRRCPTMDVGQCI